MDAILNEISKIVRQNMLHPLQFGLISAIRTKSKKQTRRLTQRQSPGLSTDVANLSKLFPQMLR